MDELEPFVTYICHENKIIGSDKIIKEMDSKYFNALLEADSTNIYCDMPFDVFESIINILAKNEFQFKNMEHYTKLIFYCHKYEINKVGNFLANNINQLLETVIFGIPYSTLNPIEHCFINQLLYFQTMEKDLWEFLLWKQLAEYILFLSHFPNTNDIYLTFMRYNPKLNRDIVENAIEKANSFKFHLKQKQEAFDIKQKELDVPKRQKMIENKVRNMQPSLCKEYAHRIRFENGNDITMQRFVNVRDVREIADELRKSQFRLEVMRTPPKYSYKHPYIGNYCDCFTYYQIEDFIAEVCVASCCICTCPFECYNGSCTCTNEPTPRFGNTVFYACYESLLFLQTCKWSQRKLEIKWRT